MKPSVDKTEISQAEQSIRNRQSLSLAQGEDK
jgi:hypothetical protein